MDDDIVACVQGHMPAIPVYDDVPWEQIFITDITHGLEFARRPCCVDSEMTKDQVDKTGAVSPGHQRIAAVDIREDPDKLVCIFHNPFSQRTQI